MEQYKHKTTALLVIVILFLLILLYVVGARIPSKKGVIIQTHLCSFKSDLLLEKNPIVIDEHVVNVQEFIDASFKYLYMYSKNLTQINSNVYYKSNPYTYLLIHASVSRVSNMNTDADTGTNAYASLLYVQLTHPQNRKEIITIAMQPSNVLVVPRAWTVRTSRPPQAVIGLQTLTGLIP